MSYPLKYWLRTIKLFFLVVVFNLMSAAQKNVDGAFLFKTWLFIEQENNGSSGTVDFPVKDSSFFEVFVQEVLLDIDTLATDGFSEEYVFLAVKFDREDSASRSAVSYRTGTKNLQYIAVPGSCARYVICVNKETGVSYRVQGFEGNDILFLFRDVKRDLLQRTNSKLKEKQFLKKYSIEGVDLECIYKGILSGSSSLNKYPCLTPCRSRKLIAVQ